ncbi:L,D-transpeptidase family protein [Hyphomonas pacifica]|uniref:L,D-TPase catalytic domain-containing protein n=1 Tax=Hyphomonas pacifica TaxID=1280941 RepID=A0A062U2B5_9PROT|nr:L,D-transpeptidase family protein [Hyphomonas pacifica]KCZ52437.1 hypothetical protein HY2_08465 [Hyphomonas pacifica]RAN35210.1 hypothetical protein HY3_09065 [Hyphomonas pacifica]
MNIDTKLLASTILGTASLLGVATASAQHSAPVDSAPVAALTADEAMGSTLSSKEANALQALITDDWLEKELSAETEAGVLMTVRATYAQHVFEPIWTKKGTKSLKRARADLFSYGIVASDTSGDLLDNIISQRFDGKTAVARAEADLRLTAAWVRMASAVSGGLSDNGEAAASKTDQPSQSTVQKNLVDAAKGDADDILSDMEPTHPQYVRLKKELKHYRELKAEGGWLAIPTGDAIEPGDTDARVPALRERLEREGYLEPESWTDALLQTIGLEDGVAELSNATGNKKDASADPAMVFDSELEEGLKAFQRHHGLEDDGVLGDKTVAALNESVESKIDRIADTMNRWRHYDDLGQKYIWANIPSFMAEGWESDRMEISMKTIVGMPTRETPVFSDQIEYAVANPKWYAPVSIVKKDKLSKLAKDPSYAARKNFTVIDRATGEQVSAASVDWTHPASAENYQLIQEPGASNALGDMKIIFPNQYSVYLHGTPGQSLFDKAQRTFSSGCIRLENPDEMAEWIAEDDPVVSKKDVEEALEGTKPERIDFTNETQIHITYMTVTVGEDGTPFFWRDVYNEEGGLMMVDKYAPLYVPQTEEEMAKTATSRQKG